MLMTLLGRDTAELPAEVLFSNIELQVLQAYAKKNAWSRRQRYATRSGSSLGLEDTWAAKAIQNRVIN